MCIDYERLNDSAKNKIWKAVSIVLNKILSYS
jgi:hypothetical protein